MPESGLGCGERAVRCLLGQPVDRVPFGYGLGWAPWGETLERWRREAGRPDLDPGRELGFEGAFALPRIEPGPWPAFERQVLEETAEFTVWRDERGITRKDIRGGGSMPVWLDHPVKTTADWERLKTERFRLGEAGRVREDWPAFLAELDRSGLAVQVGCFPWGVFGTPRDLLGAEGLLLAFHDQPELVRDMMQHLTELWLELWTRVAAHVRIDHIHIWEDMSSRNGSLISPAMIESFMMPCYDRVAEFARAHDVRLVSVDSDGDVRQLVRLMTRHGVNAFLPFEVQAGCDVLEYRRQYPELGILFGLDKRALAGTRADVDREIERARAMLRLGRYIPGFDHLIPPDVSWDLFRYAAESIRELCRNATSC